MFGLRNYALKVASTPITAGTYFKPGGTLAACIGNVKGRLIEMGSDNSGRWVFIKLRRAQAAPITVICTYQVVDTNPLTSGPTTYATQLLSLYLSQGRANPHKLRHHHTEDLITFVKECQAAGESILVAGDFNEALGLQSQGMTRLCTECSLIDATMNKHMATNFTTYQSGTSVLDYILMDEALLETVTHCGYEPFKINILSDHRGVYVDFSTHHLFGDSIQPLAPPQHRDISSRKSDQIAPYFRHKSKHLEDHKWFQQIEHLQRSYNGGVRDDDLAEKLYQRLIASCRFAGDRLSHYPLAPYSPEIA